MFWHWRSEPATRIDSFVYDAVLKGDFEPKLYSMVIDTRNRKQTYYTVLGNYPISAEEEKYINQKRAEIYLEPLSDFRKKMQYYTQKGRGWFMLVPYMIWCENNLHTYIYKKTGRRDIYTDPKQ